MKVYLRTGKYVKPGHLHMETVVRLSKYSSGPNGAIVGKIWKHPRRRVWDGWSMMSDNFVEAPNLRKCKAMLVELIAMELLDLQIEVKK